MPTVLVIEDNESSRFVICSVLERAGFDVVEAETADEALSASKSNGHCLSAVVSDVMLGMLPGSRVAARIRELHPEIPVLFVSGFPFDHLVDRGFLEREDRFLQKPFSAQMLLATIESLMKSAARNSRPA